MSQNTSFTNIDVRPFAARRSRLSLTYIEATVNMKEERMILYDAPSATACSGIENVIRIIYVIYLSRCSSDSLHHLMISFVDVDISSGITTENLS